MKGKDGKMFSTHGVIKPKQNVKASCLGCHPKSTVEQKQYEMESIINYTKGKMRKAEYWLGQLDRHLCRRPAHGRGRQRPDPGPREA